MKLLGLLIIFIIVVEQIRAEIVIDTVALLLQVHVVGVLSSASEGLETGGLIVGSGRVQRQLEERLDNIVLFKRTSGEARNNVELAP